MQLNPYLTFNGQCEAAFMAPQNPACSPDCGRGRPDGLRCPTV